MSNGQVIRNVVYGPFIYFCYFRNLMKKFEWEDLGYFDGQEKKMSDEK